MEALSKPRRNPLTLTVVGLTIAGVLIYFFAQFWTEKQWFDSVGFSNVFWTQLGTSIGLFVLGLVVMGGLLYANMRIAYRLRPQSRRRGASAVLDRYRDLLESNLALSLVTPSVVLGALTGLSASSQTLPVLAWINRVPSGHTDAKFGLDASFFMLQYPIWSLVLSTLFSALMFSLVAAAIVHFVVGNLLTGRQRVSAAPPAPVARHLSILAGLLLIVYGLQSLLERYGLMLTKGSLFHGLQYTDDQATMTAKLIVAVIAFLVAGLFFVNAFLNKLILPGVGVVLMLVSSLVLSMIYPAVVQMFEVRPNEPDKERPYVTNHIAATRVAYGVNDVEIEDYAAVTNVSRGQLRQDAEALPGIRLMDPALIGPTFEQLQQVRGYYSFSTSLDVDRYQIDGRETDAVVATRELKQEGIPDRSWNNIHTVYTHGHGFVSAYGNRRQVNGEPVWITRDIPPIGKIDEKESRVYFGEQSHAFAIVGRLEGQQPIELDTPGGGDGGGERYNTYDGAGGVPMGTFFGRVMFALRFGDINIVLSDRVNANSKILYDRTPAQRVKKVAPWLTLDREVYPAIVDGRLVWILDGYTTSSTFPNSQRTSLAGATSDTQTAVGGAQIDTEINYIRNSVKAVVDAYDGTVTLYQWDENDPIVRSYAAAFPGSLKAKSEISPDLLSHLRYPEDLFKVQRDILGRYHMTNPDAWYQQSDLWDVPVDPVKGDNKVKEPPYYLSIKWPGDDQPVFSQTTVYVPRGRQNLAAYMAVNADASKPNYGKLRILRMSGTHQIDGPGQTFNAITTDTRVAELLRNYTNMGAADVMYGNLLTLPVGGGLLYVEPIYTVRTGGAGSYPVLTYVGVRFGQTVGIGATLQEALDQVFQGDAGGDTGEQSTGQPPVTKPEDPGKKDDKSSTASPSKVDHAAAAAALARAEAAFKAADEALKKGDLGTYQKKNREAAQAIQEAMRALGR